MYFIPSVLKLHGLHNYNDLVYHAIPMGKIDHCQELLEQAV